jgi:ABC-type antimicrobial peptide transport system permease subunit
MLTGAIGVMNILLVSVRERRREIGLLKAVGGTAQQVGMIFLLEALCYACLGCVLGLALGAVASYGVKQSKENESYALALEYLSENSISSNFVLTGFASESINGERSHTYTFQGLWTVTCHQDSDGTWSICESCSDID